MTSIAQMRRMYDAGASVREVSRTVGLSYDATRRRLSAMGPLRGRGGCIVDNTARLHAPKGTELACRMYEAGFTTREIAAHFGVSKCTVVRHLQRRYGPLRQPARRDPSSFPAIRPANHGATR